ncbi:MAG: ERCC4 domain-containing protein, partial [Promethearchaeota archaeon]
METFSQKSQFVNHPLLKPNAVLKRKYQSDIFITCARSNCLVVVPTGLGKTIIALLLSVHKLKDPDSKIIFLAPTRPLVEQHHRTFQNLTNLDEDAMLMMTGSYPPAKRENFYKEDMIRCYFMTPQILQNDIISHRISLENVSLMIFDEAHRASGNYAYTFLAKKYKSLAKNPKILAMTASPGKNREKIDEVMENLYIDEIEIRTDSDPDVKPYIQDVKTIWKNIELPEEMREVIKSFEDLQKKIYSELKNNDLLDSENLQQVSRKNLLQATTRLDVMISKGKYSDDLPRLFFCKKLLANAIRISHMSELVESQGIHALKDYLDKNYKELEDGKGGKSLKELFASEPMKNIQEMVEHLTSGNVNHPKMAVLMDILKEQFKKHPESRILTFCQFRDTISNIVEEINKNDLIRAHKFIGQQKRGKKKGLTQKEQISLLERFKSGEFNTLVATSVAEEGLDIADCDVVIFYDVIPSEIRAIQRRGRTGRNSSGKVIILKTMGTREEGYFWAEKHREKAMKAVLREIKGEMKRKSKNKIKGQNQNQIKYAKDDPKNQKNLMSFLQSQHSSISTPKSQTISSNSTSTFSIPSSSSAPTSSKLSSSSPNLSKVSKNQDQPGTCNKNTIDRGINIIDFSSIKYSDLHPNEVFIMVDSRETASPVTRELSERNANISLQKLPIGDYIISERCGIERKAIPDLISSIKDGRLFSELQKLKMQFMLPVLIIEGDLGSGVAVNRAALLGALSAIMLKMEIFIYQTNSPEETAEMLIALAKKEQQSGKQKNFSIRFKKIPDNPQKKLEFILSGIPGINASRAQDLLREFRTLQNIFNAETKDLENVLNIGKVLAKSIKKYSTMDYFLNEN